MDALGGKIICIFAILILKLFFGLLPCSLHGPFARLIASTPRRRRFFATFIGYLSCFAAGIMLSVSFLHLFPETQRLMENAPSPDLSSGKFPLAEMLNVLGMFLVLFIDRSIHSIHRSRCRKKPTRSESAQSVSSKEEVSITSYTLNGTAGKHRADRDIDMSDIIAEDLAEESTELKRTMRPESMCISEKETDGDCFPYEHEEFQSLYGDGRTPRSPAYAIVLVTALSFHGLFKGMALGFQTTFLDIWTLFLGIALHEAVSSFTLGWELDRHTNSRHHCLIGVTLFAFISAIGVMIGTILDSVANYTPSTAPGISVLHCLANGSVLYVIFFEILLHELNDNYGFTKVISALIGFGLMTFFFGVTR